MKKSMPFYPESYGRPASDFMQSNLRSPCGVDASPLGCPVSYSVEAPPLSQRERARVRENGTGVPIRLSMARTPRPMRLICSPTHLPHAKVAKDAKAEP